MTHAPTSREDFHTLPNVRGTALGPDGKLLVFVTKKVAARELAPDEIVPTTVRLDGTTYRTDVVPVGIPHLYGETTPSDHRDFHRPTPGGVSIGNYSVGAGTVGSPPLKHGDAPVTLTNAHVAAGETYQYHPANLDVDDGDEQVLIGTLREQSPLSTTRTLTTDSALIDIDPPDAMADYLLGLGPLVDIGGAADYDHTFQKAGRTTGVTSGGLRATDATIDVAYGASTLRFTGVEVFDHMSEPGDSGSLIGYQSDDAGGFVGTSLLFAGSDRTTIAIPLAAVQDYHGELTVPDIDGDTPPDDDDDTGGGDDGSDDGITTLLDALIAALQALLDALTAYRRVKRESR